MSLFGKKRPQGPFWRTAPFSSGDPSVLYQHGISCVGADDGRGMISTGWTIWHLAGLHQFQAADFIRDGFSAWAKSPGYEPDEGLAFLTDLFDTLASQSSPRYPADLYSVPPEQVAPAAEFYSLRCWAGSELLDRAGERERLDITEEYESDVFEATVASHVGFVPPRSMARANAYAVTHGLPEPWGNG